MSDDVSGMMIGVESLADPSDDVFPKMVRITVVVDSPLPRCVNTYLTRDIAERDSDIYVDDTRGFADGGDDNSYILIDDEWIHYKKKLLSCNLLRPLDLNV